MQKEDIDPALIPRPGMSFRNRKEARAFYEAYAEEVGFNLSYGNSKHIHILYSAAMRGFILTLKKMRSCVLGTIPQRRHTACRR